MNITKIILVPACFTLAMFVINKILKEYVSPWRYVINFLVLLVVSILLWGNLFAQDQIDYEYTSSEIQFYQNNNEALTQSQRNDIEKKRDKHKREGKKEYNLAEETCVLIPDIDDREYAKHLFAVAVTTSVQALRWSAVVYGLTAMLIEYGIDVYDAWNKMNFHLNNSKYHFEMMEFYQDVLERG